MNWYLLVLLYAAPTPPEMMGAWNTEAACHAWFDAAKKSGDVPDVIAHRCLKVAP